MNKNLENLEFVCVFLLPIFVATIYNNFNKKKIRPNMKVVYYKFFIFLAILFVASQIDINFSLIPDQKDIHWKIMSFRVLGDILMFYLIFEYFKIPTNKQNPDDIMTVHTIILWLTLMIFTLTGCLSHFTQIFQDDEWHLNPITDIIKIIKKVFNDATFPKLNEDDKLVSYPFCCLFNGKYYPE